MSPEGVSVREEGEGHFMLMDRKQKRQKLTCNHPSPVNFYKRNFHNGVPQRGKTSLSAGCNRQSSPATILPQPPVNLHNCNFHNGVRERGKTSPSTGCNWQTVTDPDLLDLHTKCVCVCVCVFSIVIILIT